MYIFLNNLHLTQLYKYFTTKKKFFFASFPGKMPQDVILILRVVILQMVIVDNMMSI